MLKSPQDVVISNSELTDVAGNVYNITNYYSTGQHSPHLECSAHSSNTSGASGPSVAAVSTRQLRAAMASVNINILADSVAHIASMNDNLVNQLKSTNPNILISACDALQNIFWAAREDDARIAALASRTVPPLVRQLSHSNTQVKAAAVSALRIVCAHAPAARTAQKQKLVPAVAELLALGEPEVQRSAVHLLSNLCFVSCSARTQSLDSVPILVRFMASNDTRLRAVAAQALLNITIDEQARIVSMKANAIPTLVALINSSDNETDEVKFACGVLRNICWSGDRARAEALKVGAIPALLRLLSQKSIPFKAIAAYALWKVCAYNAAAVAAQEQKAISVVVSLLHLNDSEVQKSAVLLLSILCFASHSARVDALESGTIPILVRFIQSDDRNIHAAAAQALVNINILEQARVTSVEENSLPALIKLLNSDDTDVLRYACAALRSICWTDRHARYVAKHAGAISVLSCLRSHPNDQVQTMARKVLKMVMPG